MCNCKQILPKKLARLTLHITYNPFQIDRRQYYRSFQHTASQRLFCWFLSWVLCFCPRDMEAVLFLWNRKRFHFHIVYLTWRVIWRNVLIHFSMWIKRWSCTISLNVRAISVAKENEKKHRGKSAPTSHFLWYEA